ncbi:CBF-domain-containing protein [Rhodotorula sp. JG-1b]|nr:CBF-domain-containing protein [Rhodotorula sp. JG-1b]
MVKSLAGKGKQPVASTSRPPAPVGESPSVQTLISRLAASLPPSAPASASLNPLADLIDLYASLPLAVPDRATTKQREQNRQAVHAALHSLKAVFEHLIKYGRLHGVLKSAKRVKGTELAGASRAKEDETVLRVKEWLSERWKEYLEATAKVVSAHWDSGVRLSALNALMSLVKTESLFLTSLDAERRARFAESTLAYVVRALLVPENDDGQLGDDVAEEWKKWWDRCDDVRYYFLTNAASLLTSYARRGSGPHPPPLPPHLIPNTVTILESLTTMPTSPSELNEWFCATPVVRTSTSNGSRKRKADDPRADGSTGVFDSSSEEGDSEAEAAERVAKSLARKGNKRNVPKLLSLVAHRRAFQDCWLALLGLPIREEDSKRVLIMLHRQVLPHLTEPRRLMDWLVDCAEVGGTVGILALNGLFTLIQKHGLEYPDFYTKLYSLLDRSVLHVRYRPRFFRLLDIFMSSSHLPANLVASFIKRLSRLALSASPAAIVTVVPFVYNLLKRHPSCMVLVHRSTEGDDYDWSKDPFNADETDPNLTNALDSSLWELAALQQHYLASVSSLAKVFAEVMNKQSYSMEDFLDHSYATLIDTELARKITNRPPALAPVPKRQPIGDSFFPQRTRGESKQEEDALEPVDVVSRLWSF